MEQDIINLVQCSGPTPISVSSDPDKFYRILSVIVGIPRSRILIGESDGIAITYGTVLKDFFAI